MIKMKVSVIIPAYDEEKRIGAVLEVVCNSEVDEIIVVDDGSSDKTAQVVEGWPCSVELVCLENNQGKASALTQGVRRASNSTLFFLDADLKGLRLDHIEKMVKEYEKADSEMVIGVFHKGRLNTDISQKVSPHLSGQRILSREIWERLDLSQAEKFGVEIALTKLSLKEGLSTCKVKLTGVTHVMKEEKRGFVEGIKSRFKMYGDIIKTTLLPSKRGE